MSSLWLSKRLQKFSESLSSTIPKENWSEEEPLYFLAVFTTKEKAEEWGRDIGAGVQEISKVDD